MRKLISFALLGAGLMFGAACQEQDRGPVENPGLGGAGPMEEEADVGPQELPRPTDPRDQGGLYGEQEGLGGGGIYEQEGELGAEPGYQEQEWPNPGVNQNPGFNEGAPTEIR